MISAYKYSGFLKLVFFSIALLALGWGLYAAVPQMDEATRREQLHTIRMKQIPLLEQFLSKYQGSPRVADSLFRLGEAYFETAKYFEAKNQNSEAQENNRKALQTLEKLKDEYPQFERIDEALFVLANAYIESKQMEKAGELLADVAKKFPNSPVISEASLILGDYYFSKNNFQDADRYYLAASKESKTQSYVFYRLAWTSMNLAQSARALSFFEKVIAMKATAEQSGGDYSREAAKEMIFAALDVYKSSGIVGYLQKTLGEPELVKISLTTLAKGLEQRSQYEQASAIYGVLQSQYPQAPEAGEWLSAQIKAEEAMGRTTQLRSLVAKLKLAPNAEAIGMQVYNTAKKFHAEAKKAQEGPEKVRRYAIAAEYYSALLELENAALQPEVHFYLAEVFYDQKKIQESAQQYEASAKLPSKLQAQAAWNWFLTSEKLADAFQYQGKDLRTASARDEKYLEAAEYLQGVSGITVDQKRKAAYQSARLVYQLNDLDRALPLFQAMAQNYANTHEGKLSAQLVLDIFNLKKDYKNIAQYARAYQGSADASQRAELGQLEQQALLKTIEEDEAKAKSLMGDEKTAELEKIAQAYMAFVSSYPQSKFVDAALWAGFQNFAYVAAERKDLEASALKSAFFVLVSKYSNSKYAPQAIEIMGRFLAFRKISKSELMKFKNFASHWERQFAKEPAQSRGALGMLVYRMQDSESAKQKLASYFAKLPQSDDNREAYATSELWKVKATRVKLDSIALKSLKTLKKDTKKKMDMMDKLYQEVTALAKLQVPAPAVEGLKVLGEGYMALGKSLRQAPVPKELTGENLTKYRGIVDGLAKDMEAKGQEALRLSSEKAKEFDIESI